MKEPRPEDQPARSEPPDPKLELLPPKEAVFQVAERMVPNPGKLTRPEIQGLLARAMLDMAVAERKKGTTVFDAPEAAQRLQDNLMSSRQAIWWRTAEEWAPEFQAYVQEKAREAGEQRPAPSQERPPVAAGPAASSARERAEVRSPEVQEINPAVLRGLSQEQIGAVRFLDADQRAVLTRIKTRFAELGELRRQLKGGRTDLQGRVEGLTREVTQEMNGVLQSLRSERKDVIGKFAEALRVRLEGRMRARNLNNYGEVNPAKPVPERPFIESEHGLFGDALNERSLVGYLLDNALMTRYNIDLDDFLA